jgi:hypothetical protein
MAVHLTNAQIQTILAKTGANMKPSELFALADALGRTRFVQSEADFPTLANETVLGSLFPSGARQW